MTYPVTARDECRRRFNRATTRATTPTRRRAYGGTAQPRRRGSYYLDVTHPQANKGAVVAPLSKLLNIPSKGIATIGDNSNDLLMFRKSGF